MGKSNKRLRTEREVPTHDTVSVDVVIPVYNEERALPVSIPSLCSYLESYVPYQWSVTIAGSCPQKSQQPRRIDHEVRVLHSFAGFGLEPR